MVATAALLVLVKIPDRAFPPKTHWNYQVEWKTTGVERETKCEFRMDVRRIDRVSKEKPLVKDPTGKEPKSNATVLLTDLVRSEDDKPDVRQARFGTASWVISERGLPEGLTLGGEPGAYFMPALCFFLPDVCGEKGEFQQRVTVEAGLDFDAVGDVKADGKFTVVTTDWRRGGSAISTSARFDGKGRLERGECRFEQDKMISTYTIRLR